ncbi:hypothetical protein ANAPC5_01487 [Anaplasma phagocytophilum]|nr:hypothetical protein ANAPC5_01487 [Anaplasma phagocytophilum]
MGLVRHWGAVDDRSQYPRHHDMMPLALHPHAYAVTQDALSLPAGLVLVQRLGAQQSETQYDTRRSITDRDITICTAAVPVRLQPSRKSEQIASPRCFQFGGVGHFSRNSSSSAAVLKSENEVSRR